MSPGRLVVHVGESLPAAVWVPPGEAPADGRPVLLFLHGRGERGSDGRLQTRVGLGPALARHPDRWPALVVMPQCPAGIEWSEIAPAVMTVVETVAARHRSSLRHLALTGISMGGAGSWTLAAAYPGHFTRIAPICGWGDPSTATAIARTPQWVFHGAADSVVSVSRSREMVAALRAAGVPTRYTEYPGVEHHSWERAYAEPGLPDWLLAGPSSADRRDP